MQLFKWTIPLFIPVIFLAGCGSGGGSESPQRNEQPTESVQTAPETPTSIPVAGNTWILGSASKSHQHISENGVSNWNNVDDELATYVSLSNVGELHVSIDAKVSSGSSNLEISMGAETKQVTLSNTNRETIFVGTFTIDKPGYQKIGIKGLSHTGSDIASITHINIGGNATDGDVFFVKDDFYWGRRGPSVHLNYQIPDDTKNYEWFYSEMEIPAGQDTLGSYFMSNGFAEGYMGIQVNSDTERRILFSVWSPYHTDDPSQIPVEYRIELLNKGDGVYTGKFGNEGSGGQSYLVYDWKPDTRYQFLLRVAPSSVDGKTDYTAYFFSPDEGDWRLIASFRRPKTTTYVARPHSFLENFITGAGQFERKGLYGNQWLRTTDETWLPITNASFSYDATADKKARMDYQGGEENGEFYLRNTGFFNEPTTRGTVFKRLETIAPTIDFDALPQ